MKQVCSDFHLALKWDRILKWICLFLEGVYWGLKHRLAELWGSRTDTLCYCYEESDQNGSHTSRSCWITSLCWSTPKPFYKPLINKWNFDVDVVILEAPVQDLTRSRIQNIHYRSPGGRESRPATLACFSPLCILRWIWIIIISVPSCPKQDKISIRKNHGNH